ncbi:MAG TPA: FAD-linked oxidase C-terminal domain-containing protein [Gemmatimonadales bacterium]|nr:FAD-linked oxidase C-terminal domain-containing protein [Gemmatimonadales bacterium]
MSRPHSPDFLRELAEIVGTAGYRVRETERAAYRSDGLPTHRVPPALVILPDTQAQVVAIVRLLHKYRIPFVARGAGTGLSGGALADDTAALIVLTRLNRILAIDADNRRAQVEPGVVNQALSDAAAPFGLHFAPDPSSQVACTIGGNVAENAGGPHCLKYGVTANHVVAIDAVLATGELVTLGSAQGERWGPDLVGLFTGSEGTFGIALAITVRLTPLPEQVVTLLAGFPSIRAGGEAVSAIIASGIVPAALEMMDQACVRVVEASIYAAGYPTDAAAVLLCEVDGSAASVAEEAAAVERLFGEHGAAVIHRAESDSERARLWKGRKRAFGAMGRLGRDLAVQDAVVPRSALPDILERIAEIRERYALVISNVFHAGDGNLHPNISFDSREPGVLERVRQASAEIMSACLTLGGTITGEHGVGLDKIAWMDELFDGPSLQAMCDVRNVFDPEHRANPNKVIPVHACREWTAGGAR